MIKDVPDRRLISAELPTISTVSPAAISKSGSMEMDWASSTVQPWRLTAYRSGLCISIHS